MKKGINKKLFAFILIGVIVVLFINMFLSIPKKTDRYIFESIAECQKFEKLDFSDLKIDLYNSPAADRELKNLDFSQFYGAAFESKELCFEIFAYEFTSEDNAKQYFNNSTGKDEERYVTFSSSTGMTRYELIVINHKSAYRVSCPKQYANALNETLCNVFSIKLDIQK